VSGLVVGAASPPVAPAAKPAVRRPWRGLRGLPNLISLGWVGIVVFFIYAPILVVIGASFDSGRVVQTRAFLQFPPNDLSLRWYFAIEAENWAALWFTLKLAGLVAAAALVFGMLAALALVRGNFRGKHLIGTLFRTPLQIPFIVTGIAFLQAYYAISAATGFKLQGTMMGLFLGHLFVAIPYVIGSVGASLQRMNTSYEEAALSLGASRWRTFRRVTLPLIMPGMFGGALYAFLISFTDVTISLFLAGVGTQPFPVRVFISVTSDMEPTIPALSTLVFLASIAVLFLAQRLLGMEALLRSGGGRS